MISLTGKAALITGGSRGIGAAAVKLFAQAGADVVFGYVKISEAAAQVEQEAPSMVRASNPTRLIWQEWPERKSWLSPRGNS